MNETKPACYSGSYLINNPNYTFVKEINNSEIQTLISEIVLISEYYNSKLIEQLADNISKIVKLTETWITKFD